MIAAVTNFMCSIAASDGVGTLGKPCQDATKT
jgi:hypothetical protein